jgi:hypothetical protein
MMATNRWMTIVGLSFFGALGCASTPLSSTEVSHYQASLDAPSLPNTEVSRFQASLDAAKQIGAFKLLADKDHRGALGMHPAKEHLVLANDEFEVAKTMAASGDPRSLRLLARAQSDVDLAVGLAREAAARPESTSMNDGSALAFK